MLKAWVYGYWPDALMTPTSPPGPCSLLPSLTGFFSPFTSSPTPTTNLVVGGTPVIDPVVTSSSEWGCSLAEDHQMYTNHSLMHAPIQTLVALSFRYRTSIPTNHPAFCLISSKNGADPSQKSPIPSFLWGPGIYHANSFWRGKQRFQAKMSPYQAIFIYTKLKQIFVCGFVGMY